MKRLKDGRRNKHHAPGPARLKKSRYDLLNKLLETKKAHPFQVRLSSSLAERTGLEPATSAVTGQHSNQLNYRSKNLTLGAGGC